MIEPHFVIYENMIYAAKKLTVLDIAIDDLKARAVIKYKGMFARDAAIIEDYLIVFCTADRDGTVSGQVVFPRASGRFGDV
jgi:hypothetical protein